MAEILKEWLTERLQQPIRWEAEEFGQLMKNGFVVAGVLLSYHVINEEQYFLIRASNMSADMNNNWKFLSEWLRDVDVYLTDADIINIKDGKGSTLLRLFYQLFLHLDKRDRTNFIKRERKMVSNLVEKMGSRFTVDKAPEEPVPFVDDLSRPLLNEKHFIEWQKKKSEEVKDTYDYIRHKYNKMIDKIEESKTPLKYVPPESKTLTNKEKKEMEKFAMRYPNQYKNYTYDELLLLDEAAAQRKQTFIDSEWVKKYMEDLHARMHIKSDSEEFQKQIRNVLTSSLWDSAVSEEESNLDTQLAKKVMKLSQFEKQLCTQIMETKQQARNFAKNRIEAEREFTEQREQQFHQFLDNVKEQIHLEVVEIDFEKKRQNILHQRLYAEKMKRKRQHYYEICYETLLSIVDYATKYAYFQRLLGDDDIPHHYIHEWKNLYFKKQPIFDYVDPMEDLLKESGLEEEQEPEVEEIIRLELDRQEALNDAEFLEYHNYTHPWTLELLIPNYDPESEERKYEYLGNRILGHLVYTLLEIKYPYPPPSPQSNLPPYSSKAVVRGIPDKTIAVAMQVLLKNAKIHVVRLESAINHCLREFKIEMIGCTDIDLSFDKFINAAKEEDKDFLRGLKTEEDIYSKSSEINYSGVSGPLPPNTKQTQTPKAIPEEDMKLSPAAELGKYTYEALSFGDSLTDHLLAAIIVEYIRDQKDIKGFVIINYPNTYREAKILEETFSGREPPEEEQLEDRDDIYLEETIAKHRKKEKDMFKNIRISRLVNDPHKKLIEKPFESYFTCYIRLHETEDILQEFVIWDLNPDNSELIDRFYATLGLNYSMYYDVIEKELLAIICKYIIGDLSMPLKSFDKLFGSNVLSLLDFPATDDKRTKSKIVKPEVSFVGKSKEKLRRSLVKLSKTNVNTELEVVKAPDLNDEMPDEQIPIAEEAQDEDNELKSGTSEEVKILAGEEDWEYGQIPIVEGIGVALATCWEEIEKSYIRDMQQMFFAKRLQLNHLVPYCRFLKDKMEQIITLPSYKQDLVSKFQKEYNDFEDDWRDINASKNEWHCRVKDLQCKLYHICDERKLFAEQQRNQLQCDNWCAEELITMANTYISCMQAELNRSFLTYQALHDFYFSMLKKLPPNERISSKELTKINRESDDSISGRKSTEDKAYRQLKMAYQDLYIKDIQIDFSNNPFNMIIENNVKLAQRLVKEINDHYRTLISREFNEISKMVVPVRKRDENSSQDESITAEEIFKINALKCIEEWIMGVNGEMYRVNMRMLAIQQKCYQDMKLFNDLIFKTFTQIQDDINNYYSNEIVSVDRLCKYFQMAIENGRKIQETLILDEDKFIIEPNVLQYETPNPVVIDDPKEEVVSAFDFKISQLARLRSQFKIVAPTGIALLQAFIFLLQDFIFFGKETCDGSLFPESWRRVDPEQIPKLVYLIYGETAYIDWRDFLIYCLNVRFPTVDELLQLRRNFRCKDPDSTELISRNDYLMETLWFEEDFDPEDKYQQLRKILMKHFLFELFETAENMMNYSAFLLAFCKSYNPIEGFASAISMAIGQKTCYKFEECQDVICNFIKHKQYKDACLACALTCTNLFLDTVIAKVIDYCEGTTITEIPYTEDKSKDKLKGKKQKGKKSESARAPKTVKSIVSQSSKMAHSAVDVKMTYICPPCQEEVQVEEKVTEKEEVEEEQKPEIIADPTLAYAVPQDVIWKILQVCLPWHFVLGEYPEEKKVPYPDRVRDAITRLQENTDDGSIYISMFVKDPNVCRMLHKVKRFTAFNLAQQVFKVYL